MLKHNLKVLLGRNPLSCGNMMKQHVSHAIITVLRSFLFGILIYILLPQAMNKQTAPFKVGKSS